ncbi:MAG: hypothetical protein HQ579_02915 [Candidatus Omnitrophica bacterium]|nr:hypothetical protein [Candidatus Omnitrophota bacterium]
MRDKGNMEGQIKTSKNIWEWVMHDDEYDVDIRELILCFEAQTIVWRNE